MENNIQSNFFGSNIGIIQNHLFVKHSVLIDQT